MLEPHFKLMISYLWKVNSGTCISEQMFVFSYNLILEKCICLIIFVFSKKKKNPQNYFLSSNFFPWSGLIKSNQLLKNPMQLVLNKPALETRLSCILWVSNNLCPVCSLKEREREFHLFYCLPLSQRRAGGPSF